jgi:hypothetical protein
MYEPLVSGGGIFHQYGNTLPNALGALVHEAMKTERTNEDALPVKSSSHDKPG